MRLIGEECYFCPHTMIKSQTAVVMDNVSQRFVKITAIFLFFWACSLFVTYSSAQNHALHVNASGTSSGIAVGDLDVAGTTLTVEALIYSTSVANTLPNSGNVVSKHTVPSDANYLLRPKGFYINTNNGFASVEINTALMQLNKWYHIAGTYDGVTLRYYINGCLINEVSHTGTLFQNDHVTTIGNQNFNYSEPFRGKIDEVRIWNVARTEDQLLNNMLNIAPNSLGLVGYYTFDTGYANQSTNGTPSDFDGSHLSTGESVTTVDIDQETMPMGLHFEPEYIQINSLTCHNSNDGKIAIINLPQDVANDAKYTVVLAPTDGSPSIPPLDSDYKTIEHIFENLISADYDVYIKTNYGCRKGGQFFVKNIPELTLTTTKEPPSCDDPNSGTATTSATGGRPGTEGYAYSWTTDPVQTTPTIENVVAGTYIVTVTDSAGCQAKDTVVLVPFDFKISASKTQLCLGDSITLTLSGGQELGFLWANGDTLRSKKVAPTHDSTFIVKTKVRVGDNLVTNGDFEAGNTGFTSEYEFVPMGGGNISPPGGYGIRPDAQTGNPNWASCSSAEHGNMLIADAASNENGSRPVPVNAKVWCQDIAVEPQKEYVFSAWLTGVVPFSSILGFTINGIDLQNVNSDVLDIWEKEMDTCTWKEFFATWKNTNNLTSISICVYESSGVMSNNDFALDDISFYEYCEVETSIAIKVDSVRFDTAVEHVTCYEKKDGKITIQAPTSGLAPYTYQIGTQNFEQLQAPHSITPLDKGNHQIVVKDANGCTDTKTVTIDEPTKVHVQLHATYLDCNNPASGSLTAVPSGGTPTYTYVWPNLNHTEATITNRSPGSYSVIVKDANDCADTVQTTLDPLPTILLDPAIDTLLCLGSQTQLKASVNKALQYVWLKGTDTIAKTNSVTVSPTQTTTYTVKAQITLGNNLIVNGDFEQGNTGFSSEYNLSSGTHGSYIVSETNTASWYAGCVDHTSGSGKMLHFDAACGVNGVPAYSDVWCQTISVEPNTHYAFSTWMINENKEAYAKKDSILSLEFTANGISIGQTTQNVGNPCNWTQFFAIWDSGNNTTVNLCIKDKTGKCVGSDLALDDISFYKTCEIEQQVTITVDSVVFDLTHSDMVCDQKAEGTITLQNPTSGIVPFLYAINNAPLQALDLNPHTGLLAGNYTISVQDSLGCSKDTTIVMKSVENPSVKLSKTYLNCSDPQSGSITAIVSGGTPTNMGYAYYWNNSLIEQESTLNDLSPGTYSVTVIDANDCKNTQNITIDPLPTITLKPTVDTTVCLGSNTFLQASTNEALQYVWLKGTDTIAKTDTVTVSPTQTTTYTAKAKVRVGENLVKNGHFENGNTDFSTDYKHYSYPNGGGQGLYAVSNNPSQENSLFSPCNDHTTGSGNMLVLDGASAGSNGVPTGAQFWCQTIHNIKPNTDYAFSAWIASILYNNYLTVTSVIQFTIGGVVMGIDTLIASEGCIWKEQFAIWNSSSITVDTVNICMAELKGTAIGNDFVVDDISFAEICEIEQQITITVDSVVFDLTYSDIVCDQKTEGKITLQNPTSGIAPFLYAINNAPLQPLDLNPHTGLLAGTYTISVQDSLGCSKDTTIVMKSVENPTAKLSATYLNCSDPQSGSITAKVSGGTPTNTGYAYYWNNALVEQGSTLNDLSPGIHWVTVIDANGCEDVQSITIDPLPTITLNPTADTTICLGANVVLNASTNDALQYIWLKGSDTIATTNSVTVSPTQTTTYTAKAKIRIGENLVVNGDFENGNTGFSSEYNFTTGGMSRGYYSIRSNPQTGNGAWTYCGDHTTGSGNMLVVDGASGENGIAVASNIWCQTIDVKPNTDYNFSAWYTIVNANNPPHLSISINGDGTATMIDDSMPTCEWKEFSSVWNSGANTTATICLSELTGIASGNDFVIDDISFAEVCEIEQQITITVDSVKFDATTTDVTCKGDNDGTIIVGMPTSGVAPYSYQIDNGGFSSLGLPNLTTDLTVGNHTISVKDDLGCIDSIVVAIKEVDDTLKAQIGFTENFACYGDPTGNVSVTVAVEGGKPNYIYTWDGQQTSNNIITNVPYGQQTILVEDEANCEISIDFTLDPPTNITITEAQKDSVTCYGKSDGSVEITVIGGTPDPAIGTGYTYEWKDALGAVVGTTEKASNLSAGIYTVTVSDSAGHCSNTQTVEIFQPNLISVNELPELTKHVSCYGKADGTITITTSGGTAPYTYSWSHDASIDDSVIHNVSATTTYQVVVTDAKGCTELLGTNTFAVTQPDPLVATINNFTHVLCYGESNGTATVEVSGGTTPYVYDWGTSSLSTTQTASDLLAGTHTVIVKDFNNCETTTPLTISQPDPIAIAVLANEAATCYGFTNGSVNVAASGGSGIYTYVWSNGQVGTSATNLPTGTYSITVTDSQGCSKTDNVFVDQPTSEIAATIVESATQHVACNGESNGSATVLVTGGNGLPYSFLWNDGQTDNTATNLPAGSHTVTITDSKNCTTTATVIISQPNPLIVNLTAEKNVICPNAPAIVHATATGGSQPYTISWGGSLKTWTMESTPTQDTTFYATVTDAYGCSNTAQVHVKLSVLPIVAFNDSPWKGCEGAQVTFINQSTGSYTDCTWSFSDGTQIKGCNAITYQVSHIGYHDVTLTLHNNDGCTVSHTAYKMMQAFAQPIADFTTDRTEYDITETEVVFTNLSFNASNYIWDFGDTSQLVSTTHPKHIYPYDRHGDYIITLIALDDNGLCTDTTQRKIIIHATEVLFTPDQDGWNDQFLPVITAGVNTKHYLFQIFNRWGELIFETQNILQGWDGTYKGKMETDGIYTWKIQLQLSETIQRKTYIGHVNLLR